MKTVEVAQVILWGTQVGAVYWDKNKKLGLFEYTPGFLESNIELSPIKMPLKKHIYQFPSLSFDTFKGLPGMLSDSLPDKFGNLLIDQWLARQNRDIDSFSPVERLCYIGERGMGALEYKPALKHPSTDKSPLEVEELVKLANLVLNQKSKLKSSFSKIPEKKQEYEMKKILAVGTSAGGARAKAIIAYNEKTKEILSGQIKAPKGFNYWLLKFDGVSNNKDKDMADPQGYGRVEYSYYLMAKAANINMTKSLLFEENSRAHFMTQRFDRTENGRKIHMQTLCALAHYDFNIAGGTSYEQSLQTARILGLSKQELNQLFRRMVFNIVGRNQDDHTKNISFLMDKKGKWSLSPAYDVTYSYNPRGIWTNQHQMSVNGKRDNFSLDDLKEVSKHANLKPQNTLNIIKEVEEVFRNWSNYAKEAGISVSWIKKISKTFRFFTS
jgi:serine/threonine-protein kinase HipA